MTETKMITSTLKSTPYLVRLTLSLFWTYFTLGWKVRGARRAFERQLITQGMSKNDAKQLSEFLQDFKNNITTTVKQGITRSGFR